MTELKPCPFCGGEASLHAHERYGVDCLDCGVGYNTVFKTEAEAIAAWNTRAATTIGRVQVEVAPTVTTDTKCETCAYKHLSKYSGKAVLVEEDEVLCMRQPIGECEYYVVRKAVE